MRRRNPGRTFVGTCILLAFWTLAAGPDGASGLRCSQRVRYRRDFVYAKSTRAVIFGSAIDKRFYGDNGDDDIVVNSIFNRDRAALASSNIGYLNWFIGFKLVCGRCARVWNAPVDGAQCFGYPCPPSPLHADRVILSSRSVGELEKPSRAPHTQNNPYPPLSSGRPSLALSTFFTPPSGMCAVTAATEYEVAAVSYYVYTVFFGRPPNTRSANKWPHAERRKNTGHETRPKIGGPALVGSIGKKTDAKKQFENLSRKYHRVCRNGTVVVVAAAVIKMRSLVTLRFLLIYRIKYKTSTL
ncbi:hypothetical protein QTP88_018081 [Uroleucon formosanum]